MLHLTPPRIGARAAFQLCISSKISPIKSTLLSAYEESIVEAAEIYEQACQTATLHDLRPEAFRPPRNNTADTAALIDAPRVFRTVT
jgi:hypothetical protein